MRHGNYKYRIGVTTAHRQALVRNLAIELIDHGQIKSTHVKCKAMQGFVEKLVTLSKVDSVPNRRLAYSKLNNKKAVTELFSVVGPKFISRNGGYTRITKMGDARVGDAASMSMISFVE